MAKNYTPSLSQADARTALRRERRIELAGEQSRWFDLIRWGIAKETLNAGTSRRPRSIPVSGQARTASHSDRGKERQSGIGSGCR